MTANTPAEDYVPYGPEWEKEMKKLNKQQLIDLFRHHASKQKAPQVGSVWVKGSDEIPNQQLSMPVKFMGSFFACAFIPEISKTQIYLGNYGKVDIKDCEWLKEGEQAFTRDQLEDAMRVAMGFVILSDSPKESIEKCREYINTLIPSKSLQ